MIVHIIIGILLLIGIWLLVRYSKHTEEDAFLVIGGFFLFLGLMGIICELFEHFVKPF